MQLFTVKEKKGGMNRVTECCSRDLDSVKMYADKNRIFVETTLEIYDATNKMVSIGTDGLWVNVKE